MGKLVLNNETHWNTRDIRRFVAAGLRAEVGTWQGNYVVDIRTQRTYRGRGYIGWQHMMLYLPHEENRFDSGTYVPTDSWQRKEFPKMTLDTESKRYMLEGWCTRLSLRGAFLRRLARTLAHEVAHNNGIRSHREIDDSARDLAWVEPLIVEGFEIRLNRLTERKVDRQAQRAEHARKMLEEHERKLARERKLVQKWKAKVRYYERARTKRQAASSEEIRDIQRSRRKKKNP